MVDIVEVVVSDLIKVAARAPAIAPTKRRAMIDKASMDAHRRVTLGGHLFEIIS